MIKLRQVRAKLGLTQTQLGEMLGVTNHFIHKLEASKCPVPDTFKSRFARVFGAGAYQEAFGTPTLEDPAGVFLIVMEPDIAKRYQEKTNVY